MLRQPVRPAACIQISLPDPVAQGLVRDPEILSTWPIDLPDSRTSRTASSRNSRGYAGRVVPIVDSLPGIYAPNDRMSTNPGQLHLALDYKRHGVVSVFAALQVSKGTVHGMVTDRHTHVEFLSLLKQLNRAYQGRELDLVVDNFSTHTHPKSWRGWISTPASACTLRPRMPRGSIKRNSGFRSLLRRHLKHGVFASKRNLVKTIMDAIVEHNR